MNYPNTSSNTLQAIACTPSPVETVRTDDAAEFGSGYLADLCRERGSFRQEYTIANNPQFNGVAERRIAMIESTGKAASIQANVCSQVRTFR